MEKAPGLDNKKLIEILKKSIFDTSSFRDKLLQKKSDLVFYVKVSEQNIKFLKKSKIVSDLNEFSKIYKSHILAIKEISRLDEEIKDIDKSIDNLKKRLESIRSMEKDNVVNINNVINIFRGKNEQNGNKREDTE